MTMTQSAVNGSISEVVNNSDNLYEGNLREYFRIIFTQAKNIYNPYHNLRHMTHVMWLCYQACIFYRNKMSSREMRNLLIASLFHDFDHSGVAGNDKLNIEKSLNGLKKYLLPEDEEYY